MLENQLKGREYLLGDKFSAADAYLTWFFVLSGHARVDHAAYPSVDSYRQRVLSRPAIKALIENDRIMDQELGQNLFSE